MTTSDAKGRQLPLIWLWEETHERGMTCCWPDYGKGRSRCERAVEYYGLKTDGRRGTHGERVYALNFVAMCRQHWVKRNG